MNGFSVEEVHDGLVIIDVWDFAVDNIGRRNDREGFAVVFNPFE